ncbi:MAG: hypothetical protein ACFB2Z_00790 [Maricaulaceae bacterium]
MSGSARFGWVLLAAALGLSACDPPIPDVRPAHVPEDAIWVGGPDGGVYVLIRRIETDPAMLYRGCIFYEYLPQPAFAGAMRLEGLAALPPPEAWGGWNGRKLHLPEGAALVALGIEKGVEPDACDLEGMGIPAQP